MYKKNAPISSTFERKFVNSFWSAAIFEASSVARKLVLESSVYFHFAVAI